MREEKYLPQGLAFYNFLWLQMNFIQENIMSQLHYNYCRWDMSSTGWLNLIAVVYYYIKILPGAAFKALCIDTVDLSREGRLCRDSVSGRLTRDHNGEWCIWSRVKFKSSQRHCSKFKSHGNTMLYKQAQDKNDSKKNGARLCSLVSSSEEGRLKSSPGLSTSLSYVKKRTVTHVLCRF